MRAKWGEPSARGIGPVTAERPLGDVLEFLRALWGVNHGLESTSRRMKKRLGVTGPERMVVRLVGRYPRISAGQLARILLVHPSTLTGPLRRLVARSILTRSADATDGRLARFTLTAQGKAIDRVNGGTVEAAITRALASLAPSEVRAAKGALETLRSHLGESAPSAGRAGRASS